MWRSVFALFFAALLVPAATRAQGAGAHDEPTPDGSPTSADGAEEAAARLRRAEEAYREGRLHDALLSYQRAIETPGLEPHELEQAQLGAAVLLAALDREAESQRAFEIALAIDPELTPTAELGPAVLEVFERARTARRGVIMRLDARWVTSAALELTVRGAPDALIRRFRLVGAAGAVLHELPAVEESASTATQTGTGGPLSVTAAVPRAADVHSAEALDEHGGIVLRTAVPDRPLPGVGSPRPEARSSEAAPANLSRSREQGPADAALDDEPSVFASPWLWLGAAALVIGGVLVSALALSGDEDRALGGPVVQ